jgi:hypothetical protein
MRDKITMTDMGMLRRNQEDGLGPNSDIGKKLRALYGAVQGEDIPPKLLDLLEQLDAAEKKAGADNKSGKGE